METESDPPNLDKELEFRTSATGLILNYSYEDWERWASKLPPDARPSQYGAWSGAIEKVARDEQRRKPSQEPLAPKKQPHRRIATLRDQLTKDDPFRTEVFRAIIRAGKKGTSMPEITTALEQPNAEKINQAVTVLINRGFVMRTTPKALTYEERKKNPPLYAMTPSARREFKKIYDL